MDSVTLKPTFISFDFNSLNPTTQPLCPVHIPFYRLTCFKKLGSFPIYSCYKRPPGPSNTHNQTCNKYSFSLNLFLGFVQVLQQFKGLASSQTKRWVYRLQSCSSQSEREMSQYSGKYLQNGSFGLALLSVTSNAKVRISPFLSTLAANPTFISGFFAWFIAQSIKMVLNFLVERKWDLRILFASGGMPSSHSALCTALTTSVALCHGVADSLFPVCLGFSLIVMYDAIGVRRHAGMQAEVLNVIVEVLFQGHPISQRKLKELLGHTPSQVLAGAVLGILVACFCCQAKTRSVFSGAAAVSLQKELCMKLLL